MALSTYRLLPKPLMHADKTDDPRDDETVITGDPVPLTLLVADEPVVTVSALHPPDGVVTPGAIRRVIADMRITTVGGPLKTAALRVRLTGSLIDTVHLLRLQTWRDGDGDGDIATVQNGPDELPGSGCQAGAPGRRTWLAVLLLAVTYACRLRPVAC